MKLINASTAIKIVISLIIPALLYTYYYPWMYNKINHYTERGEDLDDQIDIVNTLLTFLVTWILSSAFAVFIMIPFFLKKYK